MIRLWGGRCSARQAGCFAKKFLDDDEKNPGAIISMVAAALIAIGLCVALIIMLAES